MEYNTRSCIAM